MNPRDVIQLADSLRGQSPARIDDELRRRRLPMEDRLAVKVALRRPAPAQSRLTAVGKLATDAAEWRPMTAGDRLLRRAGLSPEQTYTDEEIEQALGQTDLDPESRIAVKLECEARGLRRTHPLSRLVDRVRGQETPPASRTLQASADILRDGAGRPLVLRSRPD